MSEKGTPFINILAALIFHSAKEKDVQEETVEGLIGAHQLNDPEGKHAPFAVMKPKIRKLVEHEIEGVESTVGEAERKKKGYVNFKNKTAGPYVQALAERVDHHVSERKRRTARSVENAKQTVLEIEEEIIKKNNW